MAIPSRDELLHVVGCRMSWTMYIYTWLPRRFSLMASRTRMNTNGVIELKVIECCSRHEHKFSVSPGNAAIMMALFRISLFSKLIYKPIPSISSNSSNSAINSRFCTLSESSRNPEQASSFMRKSASLNAYQSGTYSR